MVAVKIKSALIWAGLSALLLPGMAVAADLDRGKELYDRFCTRCHGDDGYRVIPQAVDLARGHGLMRSNRQLQARIEAGKGLCPSYRGAIESRDFTNLISYIRTLR